LGGYGVFEGGEFDFLRLNFII
jgi:hypothetical protein